MTTLARTETFEQRTAILSRLLLRNRLVGILRIGVPAIGIVVFVALALQIYIGKLVEQYGISGIFIDRTNLVVETPGYEAAGEDGTLYTMSAATARASLVKPDEMLLTGATLDIAPPGDAAGYRAETASATVSTTTQILKADGDVAVTGEGGMHGTISGLTVDLRRHNMAADGPTEMIMADGSTFTASTMRYDSNGRVWYFTAVTMSLLDTPKVEAPVVPVLEPLP